MPIFNLMGVSFLSAIWRQVEKTTTRMCNPSSSSSLNSSITGGLLVNKTRAAVLLALLQAL